MNQRLLLPLAAVVAALSCFSGVTRAQTAVATRKPSAPSQICVNNKCVSTTSTSTTTSTVQAASAGAHTVKWNPGHYMASEGFLRPGQTIANVKGEIDDLNNQDAILGYRLQVNWSAIETAQGVYDFSAIDTIFRQLKSGYNKPKRLVLVVRPGAWWEKLGRNDALTLPVYLQSSPEYGVSPVAGQYGWWGPNANGASTGGYLAALWRPTVMDRYVALMQALGSHYDGDPYFEAIMFQEDTDIDAVFRPNPAPDYSSAEYQAQLQRLLTATVAAFPHTNVILQNTWVNNASLTQSLETWMIANRIAPSSADTVGETAFADYGYANMMSGNGLNWGMQAYFGILHAGSTAPVTSDLRPRIHAMMDVESPDMVGPYYSTVGGPYTPADIIRALNQEYHASHAFWTHLFGTEVVLGGHVPDAAKWTNLAATCAANPLTHTDYPASYP